MKSAKGRSRRDFLTGAAAAGAALSLQPWTAARAAAGVDPRIVALARSAISIDAHNHIEVSLNPDENTPDINLLGELKRSGLSAICMTFALDYQPLDKPGRAFERFRTGMAALDAVLAGNGMGRSMGSEELLAMHDTKRPTVIQAIEGAHFLEGHIERVSLAYQRGLRVFGLLHDTDAAPPLGDIYTAPAHLGGLTPFGKAVIKECNELGILVDLAHADLPTTLAALEASTKPVMISHTGLDTRLGGNPEMARLMRPRLIGKEHALAVADAGGLIGVWTHLSDSPADYVDNIRAMVDLIGIDRVCIGTDTKLTPAFRGPWAEPDGVQARPGERTNQAWPGQRDGFYYVVVEAMLRAGFTPPEIAKIGGGNFVRVFDAAT